MEWKVGFNELSLNKQKEVVRENKDLKIVIGIIKETNSIDVLDEIAKNYMKNIIIGYCILKKLGDSQKEQDLAQKIIEFWESSNKVATGTLCKKLAESENEFVRKYVIEHTHNSEFLEELVEREDDPENLSLILNKKEYQAKKENIEKLLSNWCIEDIHTNRAEINTMLLEISLAEQDKYGDIYELPEEALDIINQLPIETQKKLVTYDMSINARLQVVSIIQNPDVLDMALEFELGSKRDTYIIIRILENTNLILKEEHQWRLIKAFTNKDEDIRSRVYSLSENSDFLSNCLNDELKFNHRYPFITLMAIVENPHSRLTYIQEKRLLEIYYESREHIKIIISKIDKKEDLVRLLNERVAYNENIFNEIISHPLFMLDLPDMKILLYSRNYYTILYMAKNPSTPKEILIEMELNEIYNPSSPWVSAEIKQEIINNPNYKKMPDKEKKDLLKLGTIVKILYMFRFRNLNIMEAIDKIMKTMK